MSAEGGPPSGSSLSSSSLPPWLRQYSQAVTSPYPAYGLAAAFLAATPFTFLGSTHVEARAPTINPNSPVAKALENNQVGKQVKRAFSRTGLPPAYQVLGFGALIGLGGYGIQSGDVLNGAGTVTGWSLMYMLFYTLRTVKSKHPVSIGLTATTAAIGGLHAAYYFDRTSWKGAFPGMIPDSKGDNSSTNNKSIFTQSSHTSNNTSGASPALAFLAITAGTFSPLFTRKRPTSGQSAGSSFIIRNLFHSSSASSSASARMSKASRFARSIDANTIPKGFAVSSAYAGIKAAISPKPVPDASTRGKKKGGAAPPPKPDLALIVSTTEKPAAAAGTFTRNVFKAAPVVLSSEILLKGAQSSSGARARSILVNSGCANAVTGQRGLDDARRCGSETSKLPKHADKDKKTETYLISNQDNETLLLSTGVIGVPLPMDAISKQLPELAGNLTSRDPESWHEVSRAFMTTDTFPKLRSRSFKLGSQEYRLLGIDKGAGMIHPSMAGPTSTSGGLHATLLGLIATDAPIEPKALQSALEYAVEQSFNCISVDGDMSTNDTIIALANGAGAKSANAKEISESDKEYEGFKQELKDFCIELAQLIVRDGEGAEKFVEITVKNAPSHSHAHSIASSISTSALVKCALHGGDANWGRILCAVGYAPLPSSPTSSSSNWSIDPSKVTVKFLPPPGSSSSFKPLTVLKDGTPQVVNEKEAGKLLALEDIVVEVDLQGGLWTGEIREASEKATYWTCDFSKEYVAINGDYRS
ncbi:unnamed protein product [Sympodiomycopsis kandeliae]